MTSALNVHLHPALADTSQDTLLMAYYFSSLRDSGAARPRRFTKNLGRIGMRTHVVTNAEIAAEQSDNPRVCLVGSGKHLGGKAALACSIAGRVERWMLPYNECLPWVPLAIKAGLQIIANHGVTSIFSTSPPLATHFAAWVLKRRFGIRWVADFRDPLLGNPFRQRRFAHLYDSLVERTIFQSADAIIANTDTTADLWQKRYPQWAEKIHVIWNGYDADDPITAAPLPKRTFRTLTHVGTLYGGRRPNLLLASLLRLIESGRLKPEALRLRLIGPIIGDAASWGSPSVTALMELGCLECNARSVSPEQARVEIAESDGLLLLDLNEQGAALQVPAKIFDYVRIGRPVLAYTAAGSPAQRILGQSGTPHRCLHPNDTPEQLDAGVLEFLALPSDPVLPSSWFWREFDSRAQAKMLKSLLAPSL